MAELHFDPPKNLGPSAGHWYSEMKGYHWFVLVVAALGWLFDCLDQQLFILARPAAMRDLLGVEPESFREFSADAVASVPAGLSAAPLEELLSRMESRLRTTRRPEFWDLAGHLQAEVRASATQAQVAQAVAAGASAFETAADKKSFDLKIDRFSNYVTAIFLVGWATGGLIFGVLGDRIGRAKTMLITILMYSAFTGLSSISVGVWDFAFYRLLTGMGVGGEFAVGVALVAEVMPERARSPTLTILQMLSTVGNMAAALINMSMGVMEEHGLLESPWRAMFLVGALPALLAVAIRWKLKEPERWKQLSAEDAVSKQLGSYKALFGDPRWRRNAFVGLGLALSGVVGLWAVGFFTPDLTKRVLREKLTVSTFEDMIGQSSSDPQRAAQLRELQSTFGQAVIAPELQPLREQVQTAVDGRVTFWGGVASICFQIGGFLGMMVFGYFAHRSGRRATFAFALIAAFVVTAGQFLFLDDFSQLFWMVPLVGFFQLSLFAGYAVYFPELFPTTLRSTGISFCYNVGRFLAAPMLFLKGQLSDVFAHTPEPLRYAGLAMCSVFLLGLLVLPFAPETKGKPLPE